MKNKIALISLLTCLICIFAPVSVPVGPVPVTLISFVLYIIILIEDKKTGLMSVVLYLLIGIIGIPVFSGFQAGIGVIVGPTGGFVIGYLPLMFVGGTVKKINNVCALILGTIILYLCGSIWFCCMYSTDVKYVLWSTVIPFIPIDGIKIMLALKIAPKIKAQLIKARLYKNN